MEGLAEGIDNAGGAIVGAGFDSEALEAEKLTEQLFAGISQGATHVSFAPTELLLYIVNSIFAALKENSVLILSLAAICMMSVFLSGLAKENGLLNKSAGTAGIAAATGLPAAAIFAAVFTAASTAMSSLEAVGLAVLPAVAAVGAGLAGAAGLGAGAYGFVACAQTMSLLLRYVFLPFTAIYAVLSYTSAISGVNLLTGLKASLKKFFSWGLGMVMTVFSFCSVSSGLALNAADTLGARTIKYAGSMVPVVGAYLTEAADTVIASTALIKTAGGVCASLGVVLVGLSPIVKLTAYYCAVNVINAATGITAGSSPVQVKIKNMLDVTCELIGMVIGLTALMAAFFIINIAVLAR